MSLNMVIVAVVCIVVLVVVLVIFSGRTKIFSKSTTDCSARGAECKDAVAGSCPEGYIAQLGTECPEGKKCCMAMDLKPSAQSQQSAPSTPSAS